MVAHRLAFLVAGEQQHREDVFALVEVGCLAAAGDLVIDQLVDRAPALLELARAAGDPEAPAREHHHRDAQPRPDRIEHRPQTALELLLARPFLDAEHSPHDHLEGRATASTAAEERLCPIDHPSMARSAAATHHLLVRPHPLAVKGRQHQPALAQVLVLVEKQHRARADNRPQDGVRLAGVQLVPGPAEHLLDGLGLENHHESRVKQRPEGDDVPVAPPTGIEEARRREHEPERLDEPRQRRPGRKPRAPGGGRGHGRILTDGPGPGVSHRDACAPDETAGRCRYSGSGASSPGQEPVNR